MEESSKVWDTTATSLSNQRNLMDDNLRISTYSNSTDFTISYWAKITYRK